MLELVSIGPLELVAAGADKDAANTHGSTALLLAAQIGHLEVVRLLLEAGADKDAANKKGLTALRVAAQNGHWEVVRLLREVGAANFDAGMAMFVLFFSPGHDDHFG